MKKFKVVLVIMALLLALGSVGYSAKKTAPRTAFDALGLIMGDVIKIVQDNAGNPKLAAAALNKYMQVNAVKLVRLKKNLKKETDLMQKDPSRLNEFMTKINPIIKKAKELEKLTVEFMKNPDFTKAMASFRTVFPAK